MANFLSNTDFSKNQILNVALQVLASAPGSPVEGQVYYNSVDETFYGRNSTTWIDLGNLGGTTNLTFSRDGTTVTVESDTGSDAVLPAATTSLAGVMSGADKTKLDNIEALADVTDATNVDAAGATMNADTTLAGNGYFLDEDTMSSNDATKVASQQSIVAYVTAQIAAALTSGMNFIGEYNASTNSPDLDTSPSGINIGDTYVVSAAGTFFSEDVQIGDTLISKQDNPTTLAHWVLINKNIPDIVQSSETAQGIIELATQSEVNTGTDTERAVTPATLQSKLGVTGTLNTPVRFTQQIGNGSATDITVTHNIGRQFLSVEIFRTTTPFDKVECDVELDSTTQTSFIFTTAPTTNQYTVVITG